MKPTKHDLPDGYKGDTYPMIQFKILNIEETIYRGLLDIGEEYVIQRYRTGDDFTNVGATKNATGQIFTASEDTPTVYTKQSVLNRVTRVSITGSSIRMQIKDNTDILLQTLTSSDGITITDGNEGEFEIDAFIPEYYGILKYDIQIIFADSTVKTYLYGRWQVLNDVTLDA